MAEQGSGEQKDRQPRRFLVDPSEFGKDPEAPWEPLTDEVAATEVVAAYWQHLAVCVLRDKYGVTVADELARRLGTSSVVYLKRKVSGEYPVPFEELIGWVIACGDISLLPQLDSLDDLYPPGSRPASA